MIHQVDSGLPWPFHKWGCYVVTLGAMVEKETHISLCADDVMFVALEAMATPKYEHYVLDNELYVYGPDELLRMFVRRVDLEHSLRVYQIGADGVFWSWVKDNHVSYTVLKGETKRGNSHFRLGDSTGQLCFDPNPEVKVEKELSQIHYQAQWLG